MPKKHGVSKEVTTLRKKAEALLLATKRDVAAMPVKDVQRLVHELQVHQIELDMQNEELRSTQVELEASRDRYVNLYDSAPIGYLTLNPKGMILEANLPVCTLLGLNRKDLLGKAVIGFVAAKDQATFLHHIREIFETGIRQVCEVSLARQSGVWVRFESVAVPDEAGLSTRAFTALLDVTDRIRAAASFQAWQQRLERQRNLEERERIGHDLHDGILQSLYAIGLRLEAGRLRFSQFPDEAAAVLTQCIDELNSVMGEVRSFIGGLEGKGLPETSPLTSLRTVARTLARLHGRRVRVSIDPAVASGLSREQSLQILNLAKEALSNSFRHARATLIQVSFCQLKDGVRLTVRDNGTGLRRKGTTGDGHGLLNMAARAKALGGTLSVQSSPGKGTLVVLDLPVPERCQPSDLSPSALRPPVLRRMP